MHRHLATERDIFMPQSVHLLGWGKCDPGDTKSFSFFFFGQVKGRGPVKVPKDQLDISNSLENEPPSLTSFIMTSSKPTSGHTH